MKRYYVVDHVEPDVQVSFKTVEDLEKYLNGPDWDYSFDSSDATIIYGEEIPVVTGRVCLEKQENK